MKKLLTLTLTLAALGCLLSNAALAGESAPDTGETAKKMKYFLKWDADGDKQLNLEEYTEMVKAQFEKKGEEGYAKEAKKRFKRKDANQDGFVTFEEQHAEAKAMQKKEEKAAGKEKKSQTD